MRTNTVDKLRFVIIPIPVWALNYVINGELEDYTKQEIKMINAWMKAKGIVEVSVPKDNEEPFFDYYPPFGKSADVIMCECLIKD